MDGNLSSRLIKKGREKINGKYRESLGKIRLFFQNIIAQRKVKKFIKDILKGIDKNHKKSSWVNITVLITNILGFAAYCAISPVLAEYQRELGIRIFSIIAIVIIVGVIIWELICLAGRKYLRAIGKIIRSLVGKAVYLCKKYFKPVSEIIWFLSAVFIISIVFALEGIGKIFKRLKNKVNHYVEKHPRSIKWIPALGLAMFLICWFFIPEVTYCSSIVEIYGMPTKLGEELKKQETDKCAAYWKVKDYSRLNVMLLTYEEPYGQPEIMKQNSTAYSMQFFQPTARIKIKYKKDRSKYLSLKQSSFEVAKNNGYREPVEISYYNSSDKLILRLKQNSYGKLDIIRYSSSDMPQLLNSTLLYTQNEEAGENSLTSRQIEVTYNEEGLPETRRLSPYMYNANGINGEYYVYDKNKRLTTLYYLDINGEFVCNKQGIMMIDFQYEDNGNLHSIRYYSGEDRKNKTEGYQGVFCERFSYDSNGNLKERSQRDRNENLRSDNNGVCIYHYEYDYNKDAELRKEEFLGFDGEPVRDNRFQSTSVTFEMSDKNMAQELSVSIDAIGSSPTELTPQTPAISENQYPLLVPGKESSNETDNGKYQSASASAYTGQPAETVSLNQKNRTNQTFGETDYTGPDETLSGGKQENGQSDRLEPFMQYGQPADQPKNTADKKSEKIYPDEEADIIRSYEAIHYKIDQEGHVSEKRYCNRDGDLAVLKEGYAAIRYKYDAQGRITHKRYYNKGGACRIHDGYAVVENVYTSDQNDAVKSVKYLDLDGKTLVLNTQLGYAYVDYTRISDDKNEIISEQYFDEKGDPVRLPKLGYTMAEQYYDERNSLIWEAYYADREDNAEEKALSIDDAAPDAYIRYKQERDTKYQKVRRADYGVAEIWYEYEDSGNRIRELYKDEERQLINRSDTGYAAVYWKYEGGKAIDCHYERNQNQMLRAAADRTTGIAGIIYTYESGRKIREEYYDTEGQPSFRTDIGCAAQAFEYNDRGKICTKSYYGPMGELVLRKDTGYAVEAYQDNEIGQRISVRFYDTNKQPVISMEDHCAGYNYSYDADGNREYIQYIGLNGELMIRRDLGYAQVRFTYDSNGNIEKGEYFDKDKDEEGNNKPALRKGRGYACYTSRYDDNGNWTESCYYGLNGEPVLRQDEGYFHIENTYDTEGRLTSQKFYDIYDVDAFGDSDEKPLIINTKYCCAGFKYEYDHKFDNDLEFEFSKEEKGIRKTTTFIGTDGNPMVRRDLGYARSISVYDTEDHEIFGIFYDAGKKITMKKDEGYAAFKNEYSNGIWMASRHYDESGHLVLRKDTGYAVIVNEYDEYGQKTKESYYNADNKPTISTKYHCAAFAYKYDEAGNKTHVHYLDTSGKMMVRKDLGYAQMTIGYDRVGNKVSESYFDTKRKPAVWKEGGYSSYVSEYENVKWMESRYYDKKGRLIKSKDKGYAIVKNKYDEYGQCITQSYYDAYDQLKPVVSTEYHCAGFQFEYDEKGNKVYAGYLGLAGNLITRRDLGYAQLIMEYDADGIGRKEREAYFDVSGNPALDKEGGYSYYRNHYDEKGRLKEVAYYINRNAPKKVDMTYAGTNKSTEEGTDGIVENAEEGELILRKDTGYAKAEYEYEYDELGQTVRCLYLGTDGKPVISTKYLCAGFEYRYDERGNETDIYYLGLGAKKYDEDKDEDGSEAEPYIIRRDLGVLHMEKKYDNQGNLIQESYDNSYPDSHHKIPAVYHKYGYTAYKQEYVDNRIVEIKYLGPDGTPVIHGEKGYAIVRYIYDEFGQCTSEFYYGPDSMPIISSQNYCAGIQYAYDESGNQTDCRYLSLDGTPIIRRDLGYSHSHSEYDEYGNKIREFYYDAEENLSTWKEAGCASCEFFYDNGKCVEWRYFDRLGNLMLRSDTGYAVIRYTYDEYGQCIGEDYYDTERKPVFRNNYQCAGRRFGYDEKGNQTEFQYIGPDGEFMMRKDLGYAQIKWEFDYFNNQTKEVYLDEEGLPVVREQPGYAQITWKYDELGRMSRTSYFDAEDKPVVLKEGGYAYCKFYYDDEEHWEERKYFNLNDKPVARNDEGYTIIRYYYDMFGQCTDEYYYDADRNDVFHLKNNCTGISYYYDENGNNTDIWYWGKDDKIAERKNTGIAQEYMVYNDYGDVIRREYYMADSETLGIHKELGYAIVEYTYENNTETNYWTATIYYDENENYIIPKGMGYAIYRREYNELGQLKKESYYDENDSLINYIDGKNAIREYVYDDYGYIREYKYTSKEKAEGDL